MIREFICRNRRKDLTITDSEFPNQTSRSDSTKFMEQLRNFMNIGIATFVEELNDVEIFLRAGRSLYIRVDNESGKIEFKDIQFDSKIKKIHDKKEKQESETAGMFGEMESRYENLKSIEQGIIDGYMNKRAGVFNPIKEGM